MEVGDTSCCSNDDARGTVNLSSGVRETAGMKWVLVRPGCEEASYAVMDTG